MPGWPAYEKYSIPAQCSPSDRKMFDGGAMLILDIYVSG